MIYNRFILQRRKSLQRPDLEMILGWIDWETLALLMGMVSELMIVENKKHLKDT